MEHFNDKDIEKIDRQLDNLIHLVENHTRSERHLEQYANFGDEDNLNHAREKQSLREKQINNLKDQIEGKTPIQSSKEQIENLKQNYKSTKEYMENNQDSIDDTSFEQLKQRQQNRQNQIENLQDTEKSF